jgi:hypothetical protein
MSVEKKAKKDDFKSLDRVINEFGKAVGKLFEIYDPGDQGKLILMIYQAVFYCLLK